jgi:thiol-disulfide isomerase/thioredoxin
VTGVVVLVGVLALSTVVGLVLQHRSGRFRAQRDEPSDDRPDLTPVLAAVGAQPGERATLLQFSSAFCAPCRATRRVLGDLAAITPGVVHVEVDAEQHLALTRELRILSTPTTLVLDAGAREVTRATGLPTTPAVAAALASALP